MKNEIIVHKMLGYSTKLMDYCSGYTYDTFTADVKLVEACVFNLSQLFLIFYSDFLDFRIHNDTAPFMAPEGQLFRKPGETPRWPEA